MPEYTDLERIKELSMDLLHMPLHPTEYPFIVLHPFTSSSVSNIQNQFLDLTKPKDKEIWEEKMVELIESRTAPEQIEYFVQKPYKLAWFNLISQYLDVKDFSNIWADIYLTLEKIEGNEVLSQKKILKNFRQCKKEYMMSEEELRRIEELPDIVPIYRGFSIAFSGDEKKNEKMLEEYSKGISWSLSREKAEWFAKRFCTGEKEPIVYRGNIRRDDILAFFAVKNEDNIVIDPEKIISAQKCE